MLYDFINENVIKVPPRFPYSDTITVCNPDGSPLNLGGYTATSIIRDLTGTLVATFTCAIPDPISGVVHRALTEDDTTPLVPHMAPNYVWGLKLTAGDGTVLPEIKGGVKVPQSVN